MFVGDSLKILRQEVEEHAKVLGFVGAPWTLSTLCNITKVITEYVVYKVEDVAHCIQIFDLCRWTVDSCDVGALVQTLHQRGIG